MCINKSNFGHYTTEIQANIIKIVRVSEDTDMFLPPKALYRRYLPSLLIPVGCQPDQKERGFTHFPEKEGTTIKITTSSSNLLGQ